MVTDYRLLLFSACSYPYKANPLTLPSPPGERVWVRRNTVLPELIEKLP